MARIMHRPTTSLLAHKQQLRHKVKSMHSNLHLGLMEQL